jgi:hypothetical protein
MTPDHRKLAASYRKGKLECNFYRLINTPHYQVDNNGEECMLPPDDVRKLQRELIREGYRKTL